MNGSFVCTMIFVVKRLAQSSVLETPSEHAPRVQGPGWLQVRFLIRGEPAQPSPGSSACVFCNLAALAAQEKRDDGQANLIARLAAT